MSEEWVYTEEKIPESAAIVLRCQRHIVDYVEGRTTALVALGKIGLELQRADANRGARSK